MTVKLFEVGGCVRDDLLGIPSKDVDFVCIAPSFEAMESHITDVLGLKIFLSKPEFVTIRAGVPKDHPLRERCKDADFVLARKDGPSGDGRRPDFVEPGTLKDDLERRDFTVNALARCVETGEIVDLFGGQQDLENEVLRFVGDPEERIAEDGLRVLRALRFHVTKGLAFHWKTKAVLKSGLSVKMLDSVAEERISEELTKMFAHDTIETLNVLQEFSDIRDAILDEANLWLMPTLKKRKKRGL